MTIEQRNNKSSIAADTNQPNKGQLAAYKNLKDIQAKHEADGTTHSADYKTNQGNLERLESRFPSLTEPSIDKTVHDNIESNKDNGAKPSTKKSDSSTSTSSSNGDDQTHSDPSTEKISQGELNKRNAENRAKLENLKHRDRLIKTYAPQENSQPINEPTEEEPTKS